MQDREGFVGELTIVRADKHMRAPPRERSDQDEKVSPAVKPVSLRVRPLSFYDTNRNPGPDCPFGVLDAPFPS